MASKDMDDKNLVKVVVSDDSTDLQFEKTQTLMDIANNTFRELCLNLENEQTKLLELEERRKKLQEEMQRLKIEIEEEKNSYNLNPIEMAATNNTQINEDIEKEQPTDTESVQEFLARQQANLKKLISESTHLHQLDTCYEIDELNAEDGDDESSSQELIATNNLYSDDDATHRLQAIVSECIVEEEEPVDPLALELGDELKEKHLSQPN